MQPHTSTGLAPRVGRSDAVASFGVCWEALRPARQRWVTPVQAGGEGADLDQGSRPAVPSTAG